MPFRLDEFRAKIQFIAPASWPHRIYKATLSTGTVSNTRYIQEAVAQRLAEDLDIPLETLLSELPTPRGHAKAVYGPDRKPIPLSRRTVEEVK
jgi:hypothetical protein